MKLAFISDIHGNAIALESVLKDINERKVDKVFVLGDICFRGPEPKRSLDLVRALECNVIKGNADEWIVRGIKKGEVPDNSLTIMNKERDWSCSQLDQNSIEYLSNLPSELRFNVGSFKIHAFHATPTSLFEVVPPNVHDEVYENKIMKENADIFIYAHIHKPFIKYIHGRCIINIGSVGLPFDGLNMSSYTILDINDESFQTSIVRVHYDVNKVIDHLEELNYPNIDFMRNLLRQAKI
ncbi:metallophosphoesterase family protein [Lederbergia citrea]|uniref:metallophosphoesterase family protein n=1 Tax=Lederbergia citrea TaxID=2833581 RepID=UPI001BCA3B4B|nr:YfcE family phosphodiesterase [Lederbergia citrea]MBS4179133.1 metallophosphoesterase family protein [Lederbergia citrea]